MMAGRWAALLAAGAVIAPAPAAACSCPPRTVGQIIADADVVVHGEVVSLRRDGPGIAARIAVTRVIKGASGFEAVIHTPTDRAACGLPLQQGQAVRIAAMSRGGALFTNLCMALDGR
jgi:hypothetical protein